MIKAAFFGTAEFAVKILSDLIASNKIKVDLVITQTDKPVGRKQEMQSPPIKILAEQNNIPVLQPKSLKKDFDTNILKNFTVAITCQYGLLIPQIAIDAPKFKTINIHTSLLPKYRGASPVQSVLLNGETKTGITIMLIDAKMDHGDILRQQTVMIEPDDNYTTLSKKLADIAGNLTTDTVVDWVEGEIQPLSQDHSQATFCQMFEKKDGQVDWQKTAQEIYNQHRGFVEWPGIWTILNGKKIKLLNIKPSDKKIESGLIKVLDKKIFVGTKDGSIEILYLQSEGKNSMATEEFLNGARNLDGMKFESL
jgi:methionyl-tRNA formyltransferase